MTFKSRKIRKKGPRKKIEIKNKSKLIASIGSLIIIIFLVFSIYKAIASINFNWALSLFSQSLPTDSFGHTNVLLLGTGGEMHDGPDLTDTIIIASIDQEKGNLSMISIPRDLYIKDTNYPGSRINEVYSYWKHKDLDSKKALQETTKTIETLVGMPIHYYGKVNFQALVDIVDILGGVDLYVDETISDPLYPKDGTLGYEPFYIEKGMHALDGETALKFARSRHTTSDFSRSKRQQKLLFAIKEKAMSKGIISSIGKIDELLSTLSKNIETNISSSEILYLGSIANKFKKDQFSTHVIHDDPSRCGGFLYSPVQEKYGGAFVLVPAGGYAKLNNYMQLIFNDPSILTQDNALQILNGTTEPYLAVKTKVLLSRHCLPVVRYGNARNQQIKKTSYYIKNMTEEEYKNSELEIYVKYLQSMFKGEVSFDVPKEYLAHPYTSDSNIILEIGADYDPKQIKDPFDYLIDMKPAVTDTDEKDESETKASTTVNNVSEKNSTTAATTSSTASE